MIYIPTLGRWSHIETMLSLENVYVNITLVVQPHEEANYRQLWDSSRVTIKVLPEEVKGIARTRQWIIDNAPENKIIFMDDDIKFARRKKKGSVKLTKVTREDMCELMEWMYCQLEAYPVVGVSMRQGNNNHESSVSYNGQCIRVVGLDLAKVRQHNVRYDVIDMMSDRHMVLSMLELGYPNIITNEWSQDHGGSNTAGGCSRSEEHTSELQSH